MGRSMLELKWGKSLGVLGGILSGAVLCINPPLVF